MTKLPTKVSVYWDYEDSLYEILEEEEIENLTVEERLEELGLEREIEIPRNIILEMALTPKDDREFLLSDYLSDEYGYTHFGWVVMEEKALEDMEFRHVYVGDLEDDFVMLNLDGLRLTKSEAHSPFKLVHFKGADFTGSDLKSSSFSSCPMVSADFTECDLREVRFFNCDLKDADFTGAKIEGAMFNKCKNLTIEQLRKAKSGFIDIQVGDTLKSASSTERYVVLKIKGDKIKMENIKTGRKYIRKAVFDNSGHQGKVMISVVDNRRNIYHNFKRS
jgi:hypothetical protein